LRAADLTTPVKWRPPICFTAVPLPGWDRSRSIRSATASRPSAVKGHRPAAMTTNGSAGATSVQAAGSENNSRPRPGSRPGPHPSCSGGQRTRNRGRTADGTGGTPGHVGTDHLDRGQSTASSNAICVPGTVSPHATWSYSWIKPPSRSRRSTWILVPAGSGCPCPAGGFCCRALCGRCVL
jgi:hypothetical protein